VMILFQREKDLFVDNALQNHNILWNRGADDAANSGLKILVYTAKTAHSASMCLTTDMRCMTIKVCERAFIALNIAKDVSMRHFMQRRFTEGFGMRYA